MGEGFRTPSAGAKGSIHLGRAVGANRTRMGRITAWCPLESSRLRKTKEVRLWSNCVQELSPSKANWPMEYIPFAHPGDTYSHRRSSPSMTSVSISLWLSEQRRMRLASWTYLSRSVCRLCSKLESSAVPLKRSERSPPRRGERNPRNARGTAGGWTKRSGSPCHCSRSPSRWHGFFGGCLRSAGGRMRCRADGDVAVCRPFNPPDVGDCGKGGRPLASPRA